MRWAMARSLIMSRRSSATPGWPRAKAASMPSTRHSLIRTSPHPKSARSSSMALTSSSTPAWSPRAASSPIFAVPYSRRSWASAESSNSLIRSRRLLACPHVPTLDVDPRAEGDISLAVGRPREACLLECKELVHAGQGVVPLPEGIARVDLAAAGSAPSSGSRRGERAGARRRCTTLPRHSDLPAWKDR